MRVIWVNVHDEMIGIDCVDVLSGVRFMMSLEDHWVILECHSFSVSWPVVLKGVGFVTSTRFLLSHRWEGLEMKFRRDTVASE